MLLNDYNTVICCVRDVIGCVVTAKWKQSVLRKNIERPAHSLETLKARNDGSCKNHSGDQMACKNQTAMKCRLQIMQKGARTSGCEHWKFVGGDVRAHQQCFLRCYGKKCHSCAPFYLWHLYASMQAAPTPANKLRFVIPDKRSNMNTLWQEESLSRYAAHNRWRKRQQNLKKRSLWKSTKGNAMISTRQFLMKIGFGIGGRMA